MGIGPTSQPAKAAPAIGGDLDDLLGDLMGMGGGAPAPVQQRQAAPVSSGMDLMDLMGGGPPAPPAQKQAPSNTVTAYEKGGLKIMFQCVRAPENPTMIQLNTLFTNSSPGAITEFIFQAAVPKEMKLQLQAASGTALSPHNQNDIKQVIKILNPSSAPLRLMMKIQYKLNGQPVQEQAVAQTFPVGF